MSAVLKVYQTSRLQDCEVVRPQSVAVISFHPVAYCGRRKVVVRVIVANAKTKEAVSSSLSRQDFMIIDLSAGGRASKSKAGEHILHGHQTP